MLANFLLTPLRVGHLERLGFRPCKALLNLRNVQKIIVLPDKKSLLRPMGILKSVVLVKPRAEDRSFPLINKVFSWIGVCLETFWHFSTVVGGCVIMDNRITNSSVLPKAMLARPHWSHAGQLAMVDANQYVLWLSMIRSIVQMCRESPFYIKFDIVLNLVVLSIFCDFYPCCNILMKRFNLGNQLHTGRKPPVL